MISKKIPISKSQTVKVGITIGDPSGIGPEIALKALARLKGRAEFVLIGDSWVLDQSSLVPASPAGGPRPSSFKLIDLKNVKRGNFRFGEVKVEYGRAAIEYLDKALELLKDNRIDCLVTCPISKEAVNLAGFKWPGHTEYLAAQTKTKDFVMMLLNSRLKISLVTGHIPVSDLSRQLDADKIRRNIVLTHNALKELFLIRSPRIVVCGLNPHASDNGIIGKEENAIIKPALKKLAGKIKNLDGPFGADVALFKAQEGTYDSVITMYHDQALIALKISGKESGVNLTLGLPFVRTSPLHGVAFDIAGKQRADPASLIEAIKLAITCTQNRKKV